MTKMRGLTFIEVLLGTAIIGVGLIGILYIFGGSVRSSLIADQTVTASNLARQKLEQIIKDRAVVGYAQTIAANYSDGRLSGDYQAYTRNVTITEVDPDADSGTDDFLDPQPGSGFARVTVIVSFGTESVKLETLIADYTIP